MTIKQYKVLIRQEVFDEIVDLYSYIAQTNPNSADAVRKELINSICSLEEFLERYPFFKGTLIPNGKFRKMVVKMRYLIFYQVMGNEVHIHNVVDGKRDYEWLL